MLVFPEMVLDGKVPNRDFLHLYGPGSLWVLAAVFAVFGVSLAAERVVGLPAAPRRRASACADSCARGARGSRAAAGSLAAIIVLTPSGLSAMAWVGGLAPGPLGAQLRHRRPGGGGRVTGSRRRLPDRGRAARRRRPPLPARPGPGRRRRRGRRVVGPGPGRPPAPPPRRSRRAARPTSSTSSWPVPATSSRAWCSNPSSTCAAVATCPSHRAPDRFDGFLQGAGALDQPPWPLPAPSGPRQLWLWFFALLAVGSGAGGGRRRRPVAARASSASSPSRPSASGSSRRPSSARTPPTWPGSAAWPSPCSRPL